MHTILVMPCLNEVKLLASSCASLGFGVDADRTPSDTRLILVDNGSTDGTRTIMANVVEHSRPGAVVVVSETERGYIPARHRGIMESFHLAKASDIPDDDVLILQVDADTTYGDSYCQRMVQAALDHPSAILEGSSQITSEFVIAYPRYCKLCDSIDEVLTKFFVPAEADVIVSDFVSGFRLSEYSIWGGHVRDFDSHGDEIHAETSRLLIRAKLNGGYKHVVSGAIGFPSRRKVMADPLRQFVCAGFPREKNWQQAWSSSAFGIETLEDFETAVGTSALEAPIELREHHMIALFGVMPELVRRAIEGFERKVPLPSPVEDMIGNLPAFSRADLSRSLAPLFESVFSLVDSRAKDLLKMSRLSQ